jgi:hypothetical protein
MTAIVAFAILVRLSDAAGVPGPVLTDAQKQVTRIFNGINVPIEFVSSSAASGGTELIKVQIVDVEQGGLRNRADPVLGAAARTTLGTRTAWIFFRRVQSQADHHGVDVAYVLACVMAHELGHLLLSTRNHALGGLMRACWDDGDFQRAARGALRFSETEAERIRTVVLTRSLP